MPLFVFGDGGRKSKRLTLSKVNSLFESDKKLYENALTAHIKANTKPEDPPIPYGRRNRDELAYGGCMERTGGMHSPRF